MTEALTAPGWNPRTTDLLAILGASIIPMMVIDADTQTVLMANAATCALLSVPISEVVGRLIALLSNPDDVAAFHAALEKSVANVDSADVVHHRFLRPESPDIPVEIAMSGCSDCGDRRLVLCHMRDISAHSSTEVFLRLVANVPAGNTVARALATGPLRNLGIQVATIYGTDVANKRLVMMGSYGMDEEFIRSYRTTPLNHSHPGGTTVMSSETIWMSLRALAARYPLAAADAHRQPWFDTADVMSIPVTSRGATVGTIFLISNREFPRTWAFHEIVGTVAHTIAPWILLKQDDIGRAPRELPKTSPLVISERERKILALVARGFTNAGIADELGYSEATVRADISRMGRVLSVSGRREVLRRVTELGL